MNINSPILISASILNGKSFTIYRYDFRIQGCIDRNILNLNEIYIENLDGINDKEVLKPLFDSLWNACGFEKCIFYKDN